MLRPEDRRKGAIIRPRVREVFRVSHLDRSNDRLRTQAALQGGSQGNKYSGLPSFPPSHWLLGLLIDFRSSRNSTGRHIYSSYKSGAESRGEDERGGRGVEWKIPSTLMCSSVPDFSVNIMFSRFIHVDILTLIVIHSFALLFSHIALCDLTAIYLFIFLIIGSFQCFPGNFDVVMHILVNVF